MCVSSVCDAVLLCVCCDAYVKKSVMRCLCVWSAMMRVSSVMHCLYVATLMCVSSVCDAVLLYICCDVCDLRVWCSVSVYDLLWCVCHQSVKLSLCMYCDVCIISLWCSVAVYLLWCVWPQSVVWCLCIWSTLMCVSSVCDAVLLCIFCDVCVTRVWCGVCGTPSSTRWRWDVEMVESISTTTPRRVTGQWVASSGCNKCKMKFSNTAPRNIDFTCNKVEPQLFLKFGDDLLMVGTSVSIIEDWNDVSYSVLSSYV